jgi:hypothetical protein
VAVAPREKKYCRDLSSFMGFEIITQNGENVPELFRHVKYPNLSPAFVNRNTYWVRLYYCANHGNSQFKRVKRMFKKNRFPIPRKYAESQLPRYYKIKQELKCILSLEQTYFPNAILITFASMLHLTDTN